MIILTLFGTTTGLEVRNMFSGNQDLPVLEDSWIEISPYQIKTLSNRDAFCIHRKKIGERELTWIGLYRSAKEIGQPRAGGVYGAGFWLVDRVLDARELIPILVNLADQICDRAMEGDRFIRRLADVKSEILIPAAAANLNASAKKISSGVSPGGPVAFICAKANAEEILNWAQNSDAAENFGKLLIGSRDQMVTSNSDIPSGHTYDSLLSAIEAAYQRKLTELSARKEELARQIKEIDVLRRKVDSKEAELAQMDQKLDSAFSREQKFKREIEQRETKITELEASLRTARANPSPAVAERLVPTAITNQPAPTAKTQTVPPVHNQVKAQELRGLSSGQTSSRQTSSGTSISVQGSVHGSGPRSAGNPNAGLGTQQQTQPGKSEFADYVKENIPYLIFLAVLLIVIIVLVVLIIFTYNKKDARNMDDGSSRSAQQTDMTAHTNPGESADMSRVNVQPTTDQDCKQEIAKDRDRMPTDKKTKDAPSKGNCEDKPKDKASADTATKSKQIPSKPEEKSR